MKKRKYLLQPIYKLVYLLSKECEDSGFPRI